jgi:hypothetical protein
LIGLRSEAKCPLTKVSSLNGADFGRSYARSEFLAGLAVLGIEVDSNSAEGVTLRKDVDAEGILLSAPNGTAARVVPLGPGNWGVKRVACKISADLITKFARFASNRVRVGLGNGREFVGARNKSDL